MINSLFDLQIRLDRIDRKGDPLAKLDEMIDWKQFLPPARRDAPRPTDQGVAAGIDLPPGRQPAERVPKNRAWV